MAGGVRQRLVVALLTLDPSPPAPDQRIGCGRDRRQGEQEAETE